MNDEQPPTDLSTMSPADLETERFFIELELNALYRDQRSLEAIYTQNIEAIENYRNIRQYITQKLYRMKKKGLKDLGVE